MTGCKDIGIAKKGLVIMAHTPLSKLWFIYAKTSLLAFIIYSYKLQTVWVKALLINKYGLMFDE